MGNTLILRTASPCDAAQIAAIYAPYVTDTAISFEYEAPDADEFARRIRKVQQRYPYLVAEQNGGIVGYAYAGAFKNRPAYDWAVETTIYLRQGVRRQGIGGKLYAALERALRAQGILNLNACIAVPQEEQDPYLGRDSVLFHEAQGFRTVGTFHCCGYKFDRWYHMIWMEKLLSEHTAPQRPIRPFSNVEDKTECADKGEKETCSEK